MTTKASTRGMSQTSAWTAIAGVLSSLLALGCGTARPRGISPRDPADVSVPDGEARLEKALHELDGLEVEIYDGYADAPGHPIDTCVRSSRDVIEKDLAWRLLLGKAAAGQERDAERVYYRLIRDEAPARLLPLVHLKKYHREALRDCVLALGRGAPQPAKEESAVAILSTTNFEAETKGGIVVVVFMTHWCAPCKRMALDLEKFARDYRGKVKVGQLTTDRNMPVTERFDLEGLPTLVVFRNGKEATRFSSDHSYADMKAWIERALQNPDGG
jgi:thiol-disulfide isomerase/thioredoxin